MSAIIAPHIVGACAVILQGSSSDEDEVINYAALAAGHVDLKATSNMRSNRSMRTVSSIALDPPRSSTYVRGAFQDLYVIAATLLIHHCFSFRPSRQSAGSTEPVERKSAELTVQLLSH